MSDGWECENCHEFHVECHLVTKIVVSIEPREYVSPMTLCSLSCFDAQRESIEDQVAWAAEHDVSSPKFLLRVNEEEIQELA